MSYLEFSLSNKGGYYLSVVIFLYWYIVFRGNFYGESFIS